MSMILLLAIIPSRRSRGGPSHYSLAEIVPKNRRARKPYKRFSSTSDTFLVTHFEPALEWATS